MELPAEGVVRVKTDGQIIDVYRVHEEAKSVGPDCSTYGKRTRGLLGRRGVTMLGEARHIGKESKLEDGLTERVDRELTS